MKLIALTFFAIILANATIAQNGRDIRSDKKMENPSGQMGITVYPARLSFQLEKGQSATQILNIGNFTSQKIQFAIDFRDWTRDTLGDHIYVPMGSLPQSCAKWLSFDKPIMELGPGETTTLSVTMKVPDTDEAVSEMKWTMLIVKTVSEKRPPVSGAKVTAQIEEILGVGVHVIQTPPNITNKELKMLSFNELPNSNGTYRIACKNIGGVELKAKFSIELSSIETGKKTSLSAPQPVPLFPQQNRFVDIKLPTDLAKGKYMAIALIDAEDDNVPIEAAEKEITIK